jgi:hypothetical protein
MIIKGENKKFNISLKLVNKSFSKEYFDTLNLELK